MATTKIILQGGGGHARVVLDCLLSQGVAVVGIFDPKHTGHIMGIPLRGEYDPGVEVDALAIIAIGDNAVRKQVAERTGHSFVNTLHSSAIFSKHSRMGTGNMILHGSIVQAQTTIGNHVIINTGAQVDHDCVVEDFVHLAPGARLCGNVHIGEGTLIGAGAVIIPGKKIGAWATIGAGAVVINDIPDHAVAVGNPARIIKTRTP